MAPMTAGSGGAPSTAGGDVLDSDRAGGLLIRGGALRFVGYAATVGLSVVSAAVLTRYLGVSRFGQYTTVISLATVVAAVTDAGMSNIGTREYATLHEPERTELMRDLLGLRVVLTLAGVVLVVAFALSAGYRPALMWGAVAASLSTVALVIGHTLSIPLTAELRLGILSALDLARQALWTSGLVALTIIGAGVFGLLSVPLAVNVVLIPPTALLVRGRISTRLRLRPRAWPLLLRATVVFSLATAVGTIYIYAAQILTSLVASHHQSGLFAVSFRVFVVAAGVPGLLVGAALPLLSRAARDDRERLSYALTRIFETSLIAGVGSSLVLCAGAGFAVSVIAGPRYAAAAEVLGIQSWAMVASFLVAGWSFALLSLRLHRGLLLANAAALAVSFALTLMLAQADGARGAAIATLAGETTLAAASLIVLLAHDRAYRPPLTVVIKVAAATAVAAPLALLPAMPSLVRALVAAGVYAIVILATGALPTELNDALPAPLRAHVASRRR